MKLYFYGGTFMVAHSHIRRCVAKLPTKGREEVFNISMRNYFQAINDGNCCCE